VLLWPQSAVEADPTHDNHVEDAAAPRRPHQEQPEAERVPGVVAGQPRPEGRRQSRPNPRYSQAQSQS
jgi:hypothetical protein